MVHTILPWVKLQNFKSEGSEHVFPWILVDLTIIFPREYLPCFIVTSILSTSIFIQKLVSKNMCQMCDSTSNFPRFGTRGVFPGAEVHKGVGSKRGKQADARLQRALDDLEVGDRGGAGFFGWREFRAFWLFDMLELTRWAPR